LTPGRHIPFFISSPSSSKGRAAVIPFSIIPVLDLKDGAVVHARAGERARYQPIRSRLAAGSGAVAIVDGLLSLAPFRQLYIADLDAIAGHGSHEALIAELARRHPGIELWVDSGIVAAEQAIAAARRGVTPVLGSESLTDAAVLAAALAQLDAHRFVLSLDYRGERFLGPVALEATGKLWPERVIVMSLARVGTGAGPDLARLAQARRHAGEKKIFAAGGVRDRADVESLAASGYAGALVATALHDGRLTRDALAEIGGR
jgi:phosphoribosylformimino-5-aminoimidazole carboxamide ribotide isomerase